MAWLTAAEVRAADLYWSSSDELPSDLDLAALLASARVQCEEYAPTLVDTLADGTVVVRVPPENYRLAQALQARALWRSTSVGSGNQFGADGMTVTVFPMDWTVKSLLRPKSGRFKVR